MQPHRIVMLGAGNVAWHLAPALQEAGHHIAQVWSRSYESAQDLGEHLITEYTNRFDELDTSASLYIIAVRDFAIDKLTEELKLPGRIVVHTSGSVPMQGLEKVSEQHGIFYPLQTFTKHTPVKLREVPILIEASDPDTKEVLKEIAGAISDKVQYLSSEKRKVVHLAAVFANNFTNYMYTIADDILEREDLSLKLLQPLFKESVRKLEHQKPAEIQTGPAKRNDLKTIEEHVHLLQDHPTYREVYLVLTENLLERNEKEEGDIPYDDTDQLDEFL